MSGVDTDRHEGPVTVRFLKHGRRQFVSVLCPVGHLVTSSEITPQTWPGSALEAKIAAHQHGAAEWRVTCHGTLPRVGDDQ